MSAPGQDFPGSELGIGQRAHCLIAQIQLLPPDTGAPQGVFQCGLLHSHLRLLHGFSAAVKIRLDAVEKPAQRALSLLFARDIAIAGNVDVFFKCKGVSACLFCHLLSPRFLILCAFFRIIPGLFYGKSINILKKLKSCYIIHKN